MMLRADSLQIHAHKRAKISFIFINGMHKLCEIKNEMSAKYISRHIIRYNIIAK